MQLPPIEHDFDHARLENVMVGPRRELTLSVCCLWWDGPKGEYAEAISLRFGGIHNFNEAAAFFATRPHERSELAWVRYAEGRHSKLGQLFIELRFERTDAHLTVKCQSVQVGNSSS